MIGQDGLAITDGQAALRRWVTLVPDQDDAVPWAMSQLTASPMAAGPNDLPVRAEAGGVAGRAILEPTPAPSDEPTSPLPALEPNPAPGTPVAAPAPAVESPSDGATPDGPVVAWRRAGTIPDPSPTTAGADRPLTARDCADALGAKDQATAAAVAAAAVAPAAGGRTTAGASAATGDSRAGSAPGWRRWSRKIADQSIASSPIMIQRGLT